MYNRVILLFLVFNVIYVCSSPQFAHLVHKREYFCGQRLTEALSLICRGNYNAPSKKSTNDLAAYTDYEELFPNGNDDDQLEFGFLPKEAANSLLSLRFRRRSKGIVDECCRKPCSYQHLSLYCA